ncbi:unnamed protein product [Haemonchus placei]|uniref:Uncharacterized protein n=1 Tax=Haemonchus placei TaxID=6290 RepID=A0A0N4WGD4_HAEPC|nr:unnamed protein product [Haemonchus placei]
MRLRTYCLVSQKRQRKGWQRHDHHQQAVGNLKQSEQKQQEIRPLPPCLLSLRLLRRRPNPPPLPPPPPPPPQQQQQQKRQLRRLQQLLVRQPQQKLPYRLP